MISIETPFGIPLYRLFEKLYFFVTGLKAEDFNYEQGITPLSTNSIVYGTCVGYLITIFSLQYLMSFASPLKLNFLFRAHNLFLTLVSLALLLLFIEQILPVIVNDGLYYSLCNQAAWTQKLQLLYYLNYLTKYYELVDTLFLVVKKKPLAFLHYYHHSLTMVLCYTQLNGKTPVSYVPITLNLAVHVLMYFYYYLATFGGKIWWKKYVTVFQITQFVIDLAAVYFCTYNLYVSKYYPHLPHVGSCAGTETAANFGCYLLSSYLLLFVEFFYKTYQARSTPKVKKA
ncbi:GNS1/SUR4 membrane protein [Neoconidiobolus thromboides FSU 785]|nr:GNS1/SUR4 membrane protein [Neoconidiobolus thromboides FSU 785]